jgi:hypothetical protein
MPLLIRLAALMMTVAALMPPARTEARSTVSGDGAVSGGAGDGHPARHRLLFLPDARPMEAGSGYVAVHDLFFPTVGVGITGFLSVTCGASLVPGLDRQYLTAAPKIAIYATDDFALAAGALYLGKMGERGTGIVHAGVTSDGRAGSGTFGLGWGFAGDRISGRPVILAGFRVPVSGGFEVVSENWFPPDFDPGILSIGWRYATGPVAIDLAVAFPARPDGGGQGAALPWMTFAYEF